MLTELRFKNWRSLRDVTISNLTPITVFIGANSSGKTNILESLHFVRHALEKDPFQAVFAWGGYANLHSVFDEGSDPVNIEFLFATDAEKISYHLDIQENIVIGGTESAGFGNGRSGESTLKSYVSRWQLLRENFLTPSVLSSNEDIGDLYVVDPLARNVPFMLNFMRQQPNSTPYEALQADLAWLFSHIERLDTVRNESEIRLLLREEVLQGKAAPTISGGTARLIAMLTAFYALDMKSADLPGLVVIDEPDIGIHPLLLSRLVELLRVYTNPLNGHPRQFILTTHNPMFLNLFQPEEVRIVERGEQGETTVQPVDMNVANAWLDENGAYNLGDLWTTRLMGGIPE